ncbi:MAG: choice-of-anchor tandem repeat GloVer-containing protein [Rhizomicrobium sp.]
MVFELAPGGVETVLYAFKGGADGDNPESNLIADASGNLYGTAVGGGGNSPACRKIFQTGGCGIVFEIAPDTSEKILYAFCHKANCKDGASPLRTGLVMDSEANLYGTTGYGGASGRGTVFKLAPDGKETVLHAFKPGPDGLGPVGTLAIDSTGNLYGTTAQGGGGAGCGGQSGCGMVFKISPTGREDRLYSFQIGTDGHSPDTGVILDAAGNLLGTTQEGGDPLCGCGTIFEIVQ